MTAETPAKRKAVTRAEAAEMYGVSTATLRRAEAKGTLRGKKLGNRSLYRVEDLDAWFEGLESA